MEARGREGAGTLYAVSVGPGDPGLVTLAAARALEACPVLAAVRTPGGATTALDIARGAADLAGKRVVELAFPMTREEGALAAAHEEAARVLCAELASGCDVAMPVLGDASIYSTFHHVKPLVERAGFTCVVIPGVPSFCAVAAALGENLTPQMDAPLHVLPTGYVDVPSALDLPGTKVFMKAGRSLEALRAELARRGLDGRAFAAQNCGLAGERLWPSLEETPGADGAYFTTVVVRP